MAMSLTASSTRTSRMGDLFHNIGERVRRYRLYARTLSELQSLSDRELYDLGLTRGMVRGVAFEAAYKS